MTVSESHNKKNTLEFKTIVMVLMALTSLWVATIVWLQSGIGLQRSYASQRSRAESVIAFGELTRADQRVTHGLDIYSAWYEAGEQAQRAKNSANAARLSGNEENAQTQDAAASRWTQLQSQLDQLTPLLSEPYNGQYINFYEELHRESYLVYQRQLAFKREADAWKLKIGELRTAITILSVTLFLFGLSLNIPNWVRSVFAGSALVLVVTSLVIVIPAIRLPVHVTPQAALEHFVDGQILSNIAFVAPEEQAEELIAAALTSFEAAIELDEQYADAYQWHGFTLLQTRLRGAAPDRNAQAAADMQQALALGNDGSVVYTNLGWAYMLAGDHAAAIDALEQAIAAEPTECTARMNLGVALLADEQTEASTQAYDEALNCLLEESPDEQANLLASAILDLTDLQYRSPTSPGLTDRLKWFRETSASLTLLGQTSPAPTSAQIADIAFAGEIASDGGFVDFGDTFTPGVPSIYTIINFTDMSAGDPWLVRWYQNDELYYEYIADAWAGGSEGQARVRLQGAPLPSGEYQAEVYVAGNLLASEPFEIQAGEALPMQPYASSFFRILVNHPADWLVTEDHSENSYLYISDPNDDSRYVWYTTFPWDDPENDSVLSGLMVLWYRQHPDMQYGSQGEFFLGGLAQASYIPATYTDPDGNLLATLLVGMVDEGTAYMLVMQAPNDAFDHTYSTIFDPMLRSLEIVRAE